MDIDKELKAIFDDPLLDIGGEEQDLFDIPQDMRRVIAKKKADYVAQHKLCENFEDYKHLFAKVKSCKNNLMEAFRYFSTGFPSLFFQIFSLDMASLETV